MRGERDKDCEGLVRAYGIDQRLATRVVALMSKRLAVTGSLLAAAAKNEAFARVLLWPRLIKAPETIAQDGLQAHARECGFEEWELLRLVQGAEAGWRTIALEDDLLAEQAAGLREEGPAPGEPGDVALVRAATQQISVSGTEELFTPEEVARLKLSALTNQNPDERVESVRKLVFAPIEGAQKAGIFLNVLIDREAEPRVRREAIRSLEQIGFRSDMADAVRGLFQQDQQEAVYAVQRLGSLLGEAEPGEAALVLAVVLEVFDQSKDIAIILALLELIGKSAAILVGSYQKTERFFQSALRHLSRDFDELRLDVEASIVACAEQAPDLAADLLWRELQRAEGPRVHSLLINLCEALARDEARVAELAAQAVQAILNPVLPESEKARLRYGLVRLGEPAVLVALERMGQASGAQRSELIRLVDVLCTESEVSDETVQRAVFTLIDLLKLADTVTRRSVLQASLLGDRRVDQDLQQELAGELLELMTELNLPGSLDLIQNTLERIGPPALRPVYEFMRRSYPSGPATRAARAMSTIIQNDADEVPGDLAGEILGLCMKLLEDEDVQDGAFAIVLASICGYTQWGAQAGSANATGEHQEELFEMFDGIVRIEARTAMGVLKQTEEGPLYEFGRGIEFDIRVVPAAVKGLASISTSPQAPEEVRTKIVKRLLILWEGVSKVRIIWGPAAIDALISAMCSAACSPMATAAMKVRLGVSLLRFLNKVSVVRSIGRICSQPDSSAEMHDLALQAGKDLLAEWEAAELQDEERNLALLDSAGRIAANAALDPSDGEVRKLRERVLQALFSGLREGMTQVRDAMLALRDCPDLPEAEKREIDERLSKAFGLVHIGPSG
ncbi:MAG: hypothetical protein ACYS8L_02650 [Planctomycetota bacterium]|jgi:hypothetical protein